MGSFSGTGRKVSRSKSKAPGPHAPYSRGAGAWRFEGGVTLYAPARVKENIVFVAANSYGTSDPACEPPTRRLSLYWGLSVSAYRFFALLFLVFFFVVFLPDLQPHVLHIFRSFRFRFSVTYHVNPLGDIIIIGCRGGGHQEFFGVTRAEF
jgi:hypothetical protein